MRLTKQYAYALLKSTSKEESVTVYKELIKITDLFKQFPEYVGLIEFQTEEFKAVRSILTDNVEPLVLNFLEVLAKDRLLSQLETVVEDYRLVLVENNLLFEVKVHSSKPLSDHTQNQLVEMIESRWGEDYLIDYRVDPKTLGGLKLEVNGAVIDTTFRSRIDQIIREVQHGAKR